MMRQLKQFLANRRRNRLVRKLMRWLFDLYRGYENYSYDFHSNGESRLLDVVAQNSRDPVIFDVGANTGEWSTMVARSMPGARIHAFEIVPQTAKRFRSHTAGLDQIFFNEVGLSDAAGTEQVHFSDEWSTIATCVPDFVEEFHAVSTKPLTVTTTTGDDYCAVQRVDRIDFLKIDVEGYEHKVVKGFVSMLAQRRIRAIQFEYGYVNIATRFLLKDYYDMLQPYGMMIGKVYPGYVDFRPYRHVHEDFMGPNFLAVLETERELIRRLSA